MDQARPVRLAEVVGRNARAAREALGWTQDETARWLRRLGLRWPASTLAKFERGERETLTVEQLLVLALALSVPVHRLVEGGEEWVVLAEGSRVRASALPQVIRGEDSAIDDFDTPWQREGLTEAGADMSKSRDEGWLKVSDDELARFASYGVAEGRAARRLGVDRAEIARAAVRLWGRSLTAERDRRVEADGGARSLQARRGHVTRQLLTELAQEISGGTRDQEGRTR